MSSRARSRSPKRQDGPPTFRSTDRSTPMSSQPPWACSFAPGLALRKPKVDPYDPKSLMSSNNEYVFMQGSTNTRIRGTWSTIDTDSDTRQWDKQFEQDQVEREAQGSASQPRSVSSRPKRDIFAFTTFPSSTSPRVTIDAGTTVSSPSTTERVSFDYDLHEFHLFTNCCEGHF